MEAVDYCQKCCASRSGGIGTNLEAMLVEGTVPQPNSLGVPVDTMISVRFTEIPDISTFTADTVRFSPDIPWSLREGAPGEILFVPDRPLSSGTTYTVSIDGVTSIESEPVFPYVFSFTSA